MELLPRLTARAVSIAIRATGAGQGSSLPGKVVNRLFPAYLSSHAVRLSNGLAMITGTNGKTTTANMAAAILRDAGREIVHNAEGANLLSGIASAFARRPEATFALLEVDEAIAPLAVRRLCSPRVIVLTNLFRDQLDRYGEVDRLASGWHEMLAGLPDTVLVANADDPLVAWVAESSGCRTVFFGVDGVGGGAESEVSDVTVCPRCSTMLRYSSRWLSQLGDYHCDSCGFSRPPRGLSADAAALACDDDGLTEVPLRGVGGGLLRLRIPGLHTVYNALGAVGLVRELGVDGTTALTSLARYQPVFGRWSSLRRGSTLIRVNLAKNPAGMNQSLRTIRDAPGAKSLVFVLNDNTADGRDISWIWDIDMEALLPPVDTVVTTGTRRHEMALRLKYAGVSPTDIESTATLADALKLLETRGASRIYILPTYTALKDVRRTLDGWETVSQ